MFSLQVYDSRILTARDLRSAIASTPSASRPDVFVQITGVGFYPYPDGSGTVYHEGSTGNGEAGLCCYFCAMDFVLNYR